MESIARDFADADRWTCGLGKFRRLDSFGTMYGFHVRGSYHYQTKVGAIFTMIYFCMVLLTFAFYLIKWADKSQPFVMWNAYKDVEYADIDLDKEQFHFYWMGMNLIRGTKITWTEFWGSYHMYASLLDLSAHRLGTNVLWDNIPLEPCSNQAWAKALPADDTVGKDILRAGICLNPKKIVKTTGAIYEEVLPIKGGTVNGGIRIMVDWYNCMAGGAAPTTGIPLTCDNLWPGTSLLFMSYEKTINVKNYDNPIKSAHKEIDRVIPMNALRYEANIYLKWVELYTDVGTIAKDWVKEGVVTIENFTRRTGEKTMANITNNYLSQGKVIMSDMNYHLEIATSNDKTEIYRYYYTLIDVFAAVGGLLQFLTVFIILLYHSYNSYRLMRHIVLRAIIGKEGLYPEEYHLSKGFCFTRYRKFWCCCYKRLEADKAFTAKSKN